MRLPVLDLTEVTTFEQFEKVEEEFCELGDAGADTKENKIEECIDVIQASLGLLLMLAQTKQELENVMLKHCLKLQCRAANGGYKVKNWLNIKIGEDEQNG